MFLAVLGLHCCTWLPLVAANRGECSCSSRASHCSGFSCRRAEALGKQASIAAAHELGSVGSSQTRDQARVPCIGRWILNRWTPREVLLCLLLITSSNLRRLAERAEILERSQALDGNPWLLWDRGWIVAPLWAVTPLVLTVSAVVLSMHISTLVFLVMATQSSYLANHQFISYFSYFVINSFVHGHIS